MTFLNKLYEVALKNPVTTGAAIGSALLVLALETLNYARGGGPMGLYGRITETVEPIELLVTGFIADRCLNSGSMNPTTDSLKIN